MRKRAQRRMQTQKIENSKTSRRSGLSYSEKPPRLKKEWQTALFLGAIILIVMFLTSYFNFTSGIAFGSGNSLTDKFYLSGPDPYYNARLIEKTVETGRYPYLGGLYGGLDPLLNYPIGSSGGRPPLFNMLTIGVSRLLVPFMSSDDALGYSMQFLPALYGALLVIPVYFIGKRLFNRKVGLIAAFLVPLIPVHIGSGHGAAYSLYDHDSFILLLTTTAFMFLIFSLKEEDTKRKLLYAMFSGVFVAGVSLTWVSAQYIYAVISLYAIVQMIIDIATSKINKHTFISTVTPLLTGYLITFPLYYIKFGFKPILPFYIVAGVTVFGLIYLGLGKAKVPWIISLPAIFGVGAGALIFLYMIRTTTNPLLTPLASLSTTIFGGVYHTKVSLTIAEASTFGISRTIMSFGPALYLMAWLSLIYLLIWKRVLHKQEPAAVFITLWFLLESYLTASAGRFINDLVPLVALLSGALVWFMLSKFNYKQMIKSIKNIGTLRGIKRAVKLSHVFGILFVAFLILIPNAFLSFDAAVPPSEKGKIFSKDYRGAFGLDLHTEQYWTDAFDWLKQQNKNIENETDKPAVISWWDYGFYCVSAGDNPTVADNFQDGIPPAANFHTSQSEQEAVAVLIVRLAEGDMHRHDGKLSQGVKQVFTSHLGNNSTALTQILEDPIHHQNSSYDTVIGKEYGGKKYTVRKDNAMYHDATKFLTDHLDDEGITMLYRDLQLETGKSIRYYAVEGYDVNIFNVFTFLADKGVFNYETTEDDYFKLMYKDKNDKTYTIDEVKNLSKKMTQQEIYDLQLKPYVEKKDPFFNSMVYKTYVGTVGKDDYQKYTSTGYFFQLLLLNNLYGPTQGLKHFVAEYISPVTNEKPLYFNRASECLGMPAVVIAKYYEGARLNCTLRCMDKPMLSAAAIEKTPDGTSVAIKHDLTATDENGSFSLLAPAGNVTLHLYLVHGRNEYVIKDIVFNSTTDPDYYPITEDEATRRPGVNYTRFLHINVNSSSLSGYVFDDINDNGSFDKNIDTPLANVQIKLEDQVNQGTYVATSNETGYYHLSNLFPSIYKLTATLDGFEIYKNESLFLKPDENTYNITKPKPSSVEGIIFYDANNNREYDSGEEMKNADVQLIYSKTGAVIDSSITNSTGYYRFNNLVPGDYRINATILNTTNGRVAYEASEDVTLKANETLTKNIFLSLTPIPVSGYTKKQENGAPLWNVTIEFSPAVVKNNTAEFATATSNESTGYYTVDLKPGVYNVSASVMVTNIETNKTTKYEYKGTLSLSIGQDPVKNFNILLTKEEG